ncbi:MAG: rod shape-determining protein MreC [Vicinamibacteraceae bacterium]
MLEIHRRTGYLLLATLVAQVILISAQVRTSAGTRVLQAVTFGVFSQVQLGTAWVFGGGRSVWDGYFGLRGAHVENLQLRQSLAQVQVKLLEQHAQALRAAQLEKILDLRERTPLRTVAATVIAGDATGIFRTLTIDKGSSSGLRKDMAVIAPSGVVGRIVEPPPLYAAKVQLLIDREAAAGAIVERSGVGGVVVGSDRDSELPLDLQFVSNLSDAKVGDRLVTSGLDSIFPRGITIGTLSLVEKGVGLYKRIGVTPAVDFAEVGAVLVVLDPPQLTGPSPAGGAFATRPPAPTRPTAPAAGAATTPAAPTAPLQPGGRPSGAAGPAAPRPAPARPTPAPATPPASPTPPAQTPPAQTKPAQPPPAQTPPAQTPRPPTAQPATASPAPPGRPR